jgi:hypothetical protein
MGFEPQIVVEKYVAFVHSDECTMTYISMDIIIWNYAFSENP